MVRLVETVLLNGWTLIDLSVGISDGYVLGKNYLKRRSHCVLGLSTRVT